MEIKSMDDGDLADAINLARELLKELPAQLDKNLQGRLQASEDIANLQDQLAMLELTGKEKHVDTMRTGDLSKKRQKELIALKVQMDALKDREVSLAGLLRQFEQEVTARAAVVHQRKEKLKQKWLEANWSTGLDDAREALAKFMVLVSLKQTMALTWVDRERAISTFINKDGLLDSAIVKTLNQITE